MQLEWVEVTNIAYFEDEKVFVGELDATWTDHAAPGTGVAGHSVRVKTQVPGDTSLPFTEVEEKLKAAAIELLSLAAKAIRAH
ncbi:MULTISPECIES: hypothetical protein [Rhizobium]|uniref:Uncharacterized protein n=2 Tax=Rhizobium TaxID=379 RepID=K0Q576_9HYPH|nr:MULTISPECIES: hypothetical protein [Rhizobium]KWV56313.1 hypothetical protein AS026_34560 [Rhizobium altiplani]MDQ0561023.1 hypothetical protein [Rhizobium mesoamericanum]CCM79872.1 hypothetical protein BN77_p2100010 [Rhizobium mesoamericanum STM3625]